MNFIEQIRSRSKANLKRIVLPEGEDKRVIEAASIILKDGLAVPVILGDKTKIMDLAAKENIDIANLEIIQPENSPNLEKYADAFYELRKSKGITKEQATQTVKNSLYYATMMLKLGDVDGFVGGAVNSTGDTLRPGLQIVKTAPGIKTVSGAFIMIVPNCNYGDGTFIFADCAINIDPDANQLADIAIASAETCKSILDVEPRVAMLSFSTKGSAKHEKADKVVEATKIIQQQRKDLIIEGELQVDAALDATVRKLKAPDSALKDSANVLVFPDINAGNIGYKLTQRLAKAEAIGPICQGFAKPISDLSRGCSVEDIVNVVCLTALQA